jgi:hypothetical protein
MCAHLNALIARRRRIAAMSNGTNNGDSISQEVLNFHNRLMGIPTIAFDA